MGGSDARRAIDVLLADDHPTIRSGIRAIVEEAPGVRVVGEAGDGAEARRLMAALRPQVLLLDLRMPGPRPEETVAWVRACHPETAVLVLTAYDLDAYLARMLAAGAAGYLVKGVAPERLVAAVRRVARGQVIFGRRQLARARRWQREVGDRWECLTGREREVLRLLVGGLSNAAIAEALCVQLKTVEYHVTHIHQKLGVASRVEVVIWARDYWPDGLPGDENPG